MIKHQRKKQNETMEVVEPTFGHKINSRSVFDRVSLPFGQSNWTHLLLEEYWKCLCHDGKSATHEHTHTHTEREEENHLGALIFFHDFFFLFGGRLKTLFFHSWLFSSGECEWDHRCHYIYEVIFLKKKRQLAFDSVSICSRSRHPHIELNSNSNRERKEKKKCRHIR